MLLIKKGKEPASLIKYRKTPGNPPPCYDDAPADVKDDICKALLRDQGHLCAYCMRHISIDSMKIEHVRPRSVDYRAGNPAGTLDYAHNLLAVCDEQKYARDEDGKMLGREYFTCDAKKDQDMDPEHYTPLAVDPANPKHIDSISYRIATGEIYSSDPKIDADLNGRLNLNCNVPNQLLPDNRLKALQAAIGVFKNKKKPGIWGPGMWNKYMDSYLASSDVGKLPEYAGIVLWYIKKKMKNARRP